MPDISFDLSIVAANDSYTVRAVAPMTVGELPQQPFTLPFDLTELPRRRKDAAEWIKLARVSLRRGSEELHAARKFGLTLFEHLFTGDILAGFRESRKAVPNGERLRLRLRLPPELSILPWELLCDPRDEQFLALAPDLALVRYPELAIPTAPLRVEGPLQVVVVLASPDDRDYPTLRLDRERRRIEDAFRLSQEQGQLTLEVIEGPGTLDQLRARLRRPVHVLHILSHGDLDTESGEGVLLFEDSDRAAEPVGAELLRQYLQRQRSQIRLVLLNACLGALPVGNDPFSSMAASLLRGGVPAVIAMQFELADDAAAELARIFYAELAADTPVDLALTQARQHLYGRYRTRLDWAVPVLFLRAEDGVLFTGASRSHQGQAVVRSVQETAKSEQKQMQPPLSSISPNDRRLLRARAHVLMNKWTEALALYEELTATFALPADDLKDLERAREEVWRAQTITAIDAAETQQDWGQMIELLEQFVHRVPDHPPIAERLERARTERELARLAQAASEMVQVADWEAAKTLLIQIRRRRPDYTHPTIDLAVLHHQVIAAAIFSHAMVLADQKDWQGVINRITAAPDERLDDDLRALLAHARVQAAYERASMQAQAQDWGGVAATLGTVPEVEQDADCQALLAHARTKVVAQKRRETVKRASQEAAERERQEAARRAQQEAAAQAQQEADERAQQEVAERERAYQQRRVPPAQQAQARTDIQELVALEAQPNDHKAIRLVASMIEDAQVSMEQRLRAAQLAGQYGDPRPGVCTLQPAWCGPFPTQEYPIAEGRVQVKLVEFRIARYPVTVWQYRRYVEADGYTQQQWWTPLGWKWGSQNRQPLRWNERDWTPDNQPVSGVSWYEAMAFCRWLTAQEQNEGWLARDQEIRLPSEAEWEVAAMWDATTHTMRPWQPADGELWQNVQEVGIGRTSPVGIFPQGASPCGALDMAGNVWEWCCSLYSDYPQHIGTGNSNVDFSGSILKAFGSKYPTMRGGSYYSQNARSGWGARNGFVPYNQGYGGGFRVVVCSRPEI